MVLDIELPINCSTCRSIKDIVSNLTLSLILYPSTTFAGILMGYCVGLIIDIIIYVINGTPLSGLSSNGIPVIDLITTICMFIGAVVGFIVALQIDERIDIHCKRA